MIFLPSPHTLIPYLHYFILCTKPTPKHTLGWLVGYLVFFFLHLFFFLCLAIRLPQKSNTGHSSRMWDLNDSPHQRKDYESEGCSSLDDDKGRRVGYVSNSSSSAVVLEDGLEEEDSDRGGSRTLERKSSKIFGFSVTHNDSDHPPVTQQFFSVDSDLPVSEAAAVARGSSFPRAHWVDVKFRQSETLSAGKSVKVSEPMKKSRRGPRSRSSQYRGVTFYRRTGRWESHIWLVLHEFIRRISNNFSTFV